MTGVLGTAAGSGEASIALRLLRGGEIWRIERGAEHASVKDSRGMRLLARLIEQPGVEVHVLVLASDDGTSVPESTAGEVLDDRARKAYRRRITEIAKQLEAAARAGDLDGLASAADERTAQAIDRAGAATSCDADATSGSRNSDAAEQPLTVTPTSPPQCAQQCAQRATCRAFSWANNTCHLKNAVPNAVGSSPVTSGVKRGLEINIDRPGANLRSFDSTDPSPRVCQASCAATTACMAWTFVPHPTQPDQTTTNTCYLKTAIAAAQTDTARGLISGIKGMEFLPAPSHP